jgi:hypothetical protein
MSEYYGYLQGNRGETHRAGSKNSGIRAHLRSWQNDVHVHLGSVNGVDRLTTTIPTNLPMEVNGIMYRLVNGHLVEVQE